MSAGPRRTWLLAVALACTALAGLAAIAWAAKDDLTLVSRVSGANGAGGDGGSELPAVSGDGRYVAFTSSANNLSGEDVDPVSDVFVRDLQTSVLTLTSRASGAAGAGGTTASADASISADGRYVAFSSLADNLSTEDDNTYNNIFVRDLQTNTTTLVSRLTGAAGGAANDSSYDPQISSDGRHVSFYSYADNLSADDNNTYANVFVRDLQENTTTLVSRAAGANGAGGDETSVNASVSGDGHFVAFQSSADNLSTEDNNTYYNIFVRDLQANTTTYVSRATGATGAAANFSSFRPDISDTGRYVAFASPADNLSAGRRQRLLQHFRPRSARQHDDARQPSERCERRGREREPATTPASPGTGGASSFMSDANNLSTEDNNGYDNIFVRDLAGRHAHATRAGPRARPVRRPTGTRATRRSPGRAATSPSSRTPTT